jgi:hypothetical protein
MTLPADDILRAWISQVTHATKDIGRMSAFLTDLYSIVGVIAAVHEEGDVKRAAVRAVKEKFGSGDVFVSAAKKVFATLDDMTIQLLRCNIVIVDDLMDGVDDVVSRIMMGLLFLLYPSLTGPDLFVNDRALVRDAVEHLHAEIRMLKSTDLSKMDSAKSVMC